MDLLKETTQLLEHLPQAVFLVKDNTIVYVNHNARARGVQLDTAVASLITIGLVEYEQFTSGKLMLTTTVSGLCYNTVVSTMGDYHLFCLESEFSDPELRAFALASNVLRDPLSASMLSIERLIPEEAIQNSPQLLAEVKKLNKDLHQICKAVRNMADVAAIASGSNKESRDVVGLVTEWVEKSNTLLEKTGHRIVLKTLKHPAYCQVNAEKLERAFLNLISNAVKHANTPGTIEVSLNMCSGKLYLSVEGVCDDPQAIVSSGLFSRFKREPSLDDYQSGIGLGLTITHGIAAAHKGTLLVDQPKDNRIRFTLSLSTHTPGVLTVNSPTIRIINDGGHDQFLIELADILPPDLYE